MNAWKPIALVAVCGLVASLGIQVASADGPWRCPGHGNLDVAMGDLVNANAHLVDAQKNNNYDMQGHAAHAEQLVNEAKKEISAACDVLVAKDRSK